MNPSITWQSILAHGVRLFLDQAVGNLPPEHIKDTPERVVHAFSDLVSGYATDPVAVLKTGFANHEEYDEMIHVDRVWFTSLCAHHLLPFYGYADFAYVPYDKIVGLSKIPRMIEALARRVQIQERLTTQIVDIFQETVKPHGCGVQIVANHMCVCARGVRQHGSVTTTRAFRGCFADEMETRSEYMAYVAKYGDKL